MTVVKMYINFKINLAKSGKSLRLDMKIVCVNSVMYSFSNAVFNGVYIIHD